jgi:hypothetical protein
MYQGHHFTSFVGSVRNAERQGFIERITSVREANRTPLPAPTPAGEIFSRWEASRAPPTPAESPRAPSTAASARSVRTGRSSRGSMVASSRGPHSARIASRLESARRELDGLTELQQARETIRQLRGELGLPIVKEDSTPEEGGGGGAPGTPRQAQSPAKRRPFPPTDIFPEGTGGEDIIFYRTSEYKSDSQRGPRVGGRRAELPTSWRG